MPGVVFVAAVLRLNDVGGPAVALALSGMDDGPEDGEPTLLVLALPIGKTKLVLVEEDELCVLEDESMAAWLTLIEGRLGRGAVLIELLGEIPDDNPVPVRAPATEEPVPMALDKKLEDGLTPVE